MEAEKPNSCKGRRLAIGDIHACGKTFLALLNSIQLTKDDNLYILGDMINRGKRSKKVIKTILDLKENGYKVFPLRGNHEEFLITAMSTYSSKDFIKLCKKIDLEWLLKSSNPFKIKTKYLNFFNELPYYYDLGNVLLSHAGFDLGQTDIFANSEAMVQQRTHTCIENQKKGTIIVHGHTPISYNRIKKTVISQAPIINIDNGCVYNDKGKGKCHLICLNLDSLEIIAQKNIE